MWLQSLRALHDALIGREAAVVVTLERFVGDDVVVVVVHQHDVLVDTVGPYRKANYIVGEELPYGFNPDVELLVRSQGSRGVGVGW